MKKILALLITLFCFFGCSKQDVPENNDIYYVKYEFSCQVVQYGKVYSTPYTITYVGSDLDEHSRDFKTGEKEEITCGPFKYGDRIKLSLEHFYHDNVGGSSQANVVLDVFVSKNNSPFSLQKTESSSSQEPHCTTLEYAILY